MAGGRSTVAGGGPGRLEGYRPTSRVAGGRPTVAGGSSTAAGGRSTVAEGRSTADGGISMTACLRGPRWPEGGLRWPVRSPERLEGG